MFEIKPTPKIVDTESYSTFSKKLEKDLNFLQGLSDLIRCNGRSKIFNIKSKSFYFSPELLDNAVQTLSSIQLCCSIGSFSDANSLIRKYRDDLLLYVYFLDIINNRKIFIKEDVQKPNTSSSDDEVALEAWLTNTVNDLPKKQRFKISFENYMDRFKQNPDVGEILSNYGLSNYWEELRGKLNDYVHNNGLAYSRHNNTRFGDKNLAPLLENVNIRVSYITTFFLTLIIITDATLISSTDMRDHLELGLTPPDDCQYWIAKFIQEYIDEKVVPLHPELKTYLKDRNTYGMDIN